ncbi:hypothetical protein DL96DRAFT_925351 [Flagelloscypha sp. PMI_526]|nr:hypothetical protein DL96DRAFT_925351 [Flagelloscypha sp. PMI_526]
MMTLNSGLALIQDGRNGSVPPTLDTRLGSSLSISRPRDDRPAPVQSEVALRALEKRQQAAATASSKPLEERISDRPTPSLQERIAAVPMPSTLSPPHPTNGSSNQPELSVKTEPEDTKMKTPPVQPPSPTGSSRDTKRSSSVHSSPSKSNPSLEARLSSALPSGTTRPRSTSRTRPDDGRPMSYNRDPRDRARVPPPGHWGPLRSSL